MSRKRLITTILALVLVLGLAACASPSGTVDAGKEAELQAQIDALQAQLGEAQSASGDTAELEAQLEQLQAALEATQNPVVIEFWTTDNEEARVQVYEAVAARYMEANPGVEIRIVPIEEAGISQRISTAVAANRLPDIIRMGIERVAAFSADGLLDEEAAMATIQAIGEDDFRTGPLQMVVDPATGNYAALPFDGWIQALWYRQDVFDTLGLSAPVTWDEITSACETLPGNDDLLYGMTLGTDPGQNYPHQVFEQVAISNDAWPFDQAGNVTMDTPEMVAALDFYAGLQDCSLPGPQYWRGAREAYEYGQSGMLFYSTYIMDDLVDGSGLEAGGNVELAYTDLAARTGFAPSMEGPNGAASYGQLVTLSIMKGADPVAQDVVKFFMTGENYQEILALAPFGKVPVLESAVEEWKSASDYFANYPPETLEAIAAGYDSMQRWLFRPDYDATQRAVVGDIEGRLLIPQVISNIAIEGTMTPAEGAAWLQQQVESIYAERKAGS
ncbi:MAG: extracellular solute-binding protein [Anaerolineales bacterium]|nr:extracellular solute-binding protein [Anaerolineales bacterium]